MLVTLDEGFRAKLDLIKRNLVEIVTEEELIERLRSDGLSGYVGYEPSKEIHIGWLVWMLKSRDLVRLGAKVKALEASWHAWINDKGELDELREYGKRVRQILNKLDVQVEFIDADAVLSDKEYWKLFLKVSKTISLSRVRRAVVVMGRRSDHIEHDFSKIVYPVMQAVDALYLSVDFALGAADQRRAFLISRDAADKLGLKRPIILCTPVLLGLSSVDKIVGIDVTDQDSLVEYKMSTAKPDDAILLSDDPDSIKKKILNAYCPPRETKLNPVLDIAKYVILPYYGHMRIERDNEVVDVRSAEELEGLYVRGLVRPIELKSAVANYLIELIRFLRA